MIDFRAGIATVFFTFHNVSIKSRSVMLLLSHAETFTFHNVSIKSKYPVMSIRDNLVFTFHNVSIKSRFQRR